MKQFTVVFPLSKKDGKTFILLGEHAPGKPLSGYLNGYGGKVEEGETVLEAAEREFVEELGMTHLNISYVGSVIHQNKEIFFYLTEVDIDQSVLSSEMVNNTWFDLHDDAFVEKMLPGDDEIIKFVRENSINFFEGLDLREFRIVKEGAEIDSAVKELNKSIGH